MTKDQAIAIGRAVQFDIAYNEATAELTTRIADELMKAAAGHECQWFLCSYESAYDTGCGHAMSTDEPLKNYLTGGMIYCPYCAGRIVPTEAEWQVAERVEREAAETT